MCASSSTIMTTTATTSKVDTTPEDHHHHHPCVQQRDSIELVVPTTESGFEKRRRWIESGILFFSVCYGFVYWWNPHIPVRQELCHFGEHHFKDGEEEERDCFRPDLIAYKITTLIAMTTMGLLGVYHWHACPRLHQRECVTTMDRLFRPLVAADVHMVLAFCFQLWDFVISWTIPENMDVLFLMHHVLAMITAYCSLEYQMMGYYAIFYGGCSEISSIFLVLLDTKHEVFESILSLLVSPSNMDQVLLVCKIMFFGTFTYYRIVGWIYYSIPLWKDCQHVMNSKTFLPNPKSRLISTLL